ncbi:MAG: PQQ-dependent sugar dehydrogenase [Bacteroidota bacterium]
MNPCRPTLFFLILIPLCTFCSRPEPLSDRRASEPLGILELDETRLLVTEVASGLDAAWNVEWGPDGWIWITEHGGRISRVHPETREFQPLITIEDVWHERSRGLMSLVFHPEFTENGWLYAHYVWSPNEEDFYGRIERYRWDGDTLVEPTSIVDDLPGNTGHNGARMMVGPDSLLWVGTGEALQADLAQEPYTDHGKVLRMNWDGRPADGNPYPGHRTWSTGHRNIQGITHGRGEIYAAEHGPDNDDEVNHIQPAANFGWPDVHGYCDSESERDYCRDSLVVEPMVAFTPVIAAAALEYYDHDAIPEWRHSLLLSSLRIQALRALKLNASGDEIEQIQIYFQQVWGRIRDLEVTPDGQVLLATSNLDWYYDYRPELVTEDQIARGDRILMLEPLTAELESQLGDLSDIPVLREEPEALYHGDEEADETAEPGQQLYTTHCSSCHGANAEGMGAIAPGLSDNSYLEGDIEQLIDVVLRGSEAIERDGPAIYEWAMPAFATLDNEEIATILTYLRNRYTDHDDTIPASEVSDRRESNP